MFLRHVMLSRRCRPRASSVRAMLSTMAAVVFIGALTVAPARAGLIYVTGSMNFASNKQSMWGPGNALANTGSIFVGPQWNNTGSLGTGIGDGLFGDKYGTEFWMHSQGKMGLKFGYSIDSGSVDATADFGAKATVPDVSAGQYFSIATQSNFDHGTIKTQSPEISASMSAVVQVSGSIGAKACFVECTSSSSALPSINLDQSIVSIDPNAVKLFDGILPGGKPLAKLDLLGGAKLTLAGGVGVPGFKVTNQFGNPVYTSLPPLAPTTELGHIAFNVPNVATTGSGSGPVITSEGKDKLLDLKLDLDGILSQAVEAATGIPLTFGTTVKFGDWGQVHLDLIDIDVGPYLDFSQNFEFDPNLWVNLSFNNPVDVKGLGLQSSWVGPWDQLPQFAISRTTTFTPTFFINASLKNDTGLVLGLDGTWELLKASGQLKFGKLPKLVIGPTSLNTLLGWGDKMFDVSTKPMSIFESTFKLDGFNRIAASPFTIKIGQSEGGGSPDGGSVDVPEPDSLLLLLFGLCLLAGGMGTNARFAKHGAAVDGI